MYILGELGYVMPLRINPQHIISFYFVGLEKSFSAASGRLCVTEPAIHQQIKALELQFGVKLVYVKKKRACLTKTGEKLFTYAEEFFNKAAIIENFLKSYALTNLRLAIASSLLMYLMPVIDKFKESQPDVQVTIQEGPSMILGEELIDLKHDICLIGSFNRFERLRILRIPEVEEMVFVASPQHPLAKVTTLTWEDVARWPLVIQREGSMARAILDQNFRARGVKPSIGTEVGNPELMKGLARENRGIALMFLPSVRDDLALGRLTMIPLADGPIKLDIDVLMNRELAMSPIAEIFLKVIKEYFHYSP
ncbi:MAG: LysR family transcriptional regulator [Syntrophales bacterium]